MVLVDERDSGPQVDLAPGQGRKRFSNLLTRAVSAVVLAPIALGAAYVGGWPFSALLAVAGGIALVEWMRLTGHSETVVLVLSLGGLVASGSAASLGYTAYAFALAGPLAGLLWIVSKLKVGRGLWVAAGFLYIDIPVLSLIYLRDTQGPALMFWILGIIWAMDVGAYVFGSAIGGAKLAPSLSPNKTWSGLVGGMLCAAGISVLLGAWFDLGSLANLVWIGAALAVWSQIGDVFESSIKRRFRVKDSGHVIPGHGGVLDRIDSLVFAAPMVALAIWIFQVL